MRGSLVAHHDDAGAVGDRLSALVGHAGGDVDHRQRAALLLMHAGDAGAGSQLVADVAPARDRRTSARRAGPGSMSTLSASSRAKAVVVVEHLQAEKIGRRDRPVGEAGRLRRAGVAVDGVRLAERVEEELEPARLDAGAGGGSVIPMAEASTIALRPLVQGHDAGAAEAEVVLERCAPPRPGVGPGGPAELPGQLGALGEPGRAERWPLRSRPPEGLVTTRPPKVLSPASIKLRRPPRGKARAPRR